MKHGVVALCWLIASLILGAASEGLAGELIGRVVAVSDGDTLTVLDSQKTQHRIRLSGIDAPEKKQAFGERSRQNLASLAFGKTVTVHWYKRDRYGRLVGKVPVDGKDACLQQVIDGYAWWYRAYAKEQSLEDRRNYAAAEEGARAARRGLWYDPNPVPPWEWRRKSREDRRVR